METDAASMEKTADGQADLATELAAAKELAEENHRKFLYAMADFENFKKRIERQFTDIALTGRKQILLKFLPVLDNLERALGHDAGGSADPLRDGLTATLRGFEGLLSSEGVKSFSLLGKPFDPKLAEAIGTQPSTEAPDTIIAEPLRGYYIGDDVLRVAHVITAKSGND